MYDYIYSRTVGGLRVWFAGGYYWETAYFTSEAETRSAEQSTEFDGAQQEYAELFGQPTFLTCTSRCSD